MSERSFSGAPAAALSALFLAGLAGCDSAPMKPASGPEKPVAAPLTAPAREVSDKTRWIWAGGDLQGWTVEPSNAVVSWPQTGGIAVISAADPGSLDVFLRSPYLSVAGKDFTRVIVDLEAVVPGSEIDSALYYSTPQHDDSFDYRGGPMNAGVLAVGERRKLIYDMVNQAAGAPDWTESLITQIRFDLPQGEGAHYIVHAITLCPAVSQDCS